MNIRLVVPESPSANDTGEAIDRFTVGARRSSSATSRSRVRGRPRGPAARPTHPVVPEFERDHHRLSERAIICLHPLAEVVRLRTASELSRVRLHERKKAGGRLTRTRIPTNDFIQRATPTHSLTATP